MLVLTACCSTCWQLQVTYAASKQRAVSLDQLLRKPPLLLLLLLLLIYSAPMLSVSGHAAAPQPAWSTLTHRSALAAQQWALRWW
jgi:hypothetical protein